MRSEQVLHIGIIIYIPIFLLKIFIFGIRHWFLWIFNHIVYNNIIAKNLSNDIILDILYTRIEKISNAVSVHLNNTRIMKVVVIVFDCHKKGSIISRQVNVIIFIKNIWEFVFIYLLYDAIKTIGESEKV